MSIRVGNSVFYAFDVIGVTMLKSPEGYNTFLVYHERYSKPLLVPAPEDAEAAQALADIQQDMNTWAVVKMRLDVESQKAILENKATPPEKKKAKSKTSNPAPPPPRPVETSPVHADEEKQIEVEAERSRRRAARSKPVKKEVEEEEDEADENKPLIADASDDEMGYCQQFYKFRKAF
jgi:type IV secretory pathway VirB10-like protein